MPRARKVTPMVEPFGGRPQPAKTPTGLAYGEHQALAQAQAAIPLPGGGAPNPSAPATAPPTQTAPPPAAGAAAPPGALAAMEALAPPTPLTAPTGRPDEPITAGLSGSPLPPTPAGPDPRLFLQALYQVAPNADVADLLQHLDG